MRIRLRHGALALAALLLPAQLRAQIILNEPISARVTSMGGGGVADNSTPSTIVINPANVAGIARLYAQGQMETADFSDDYWIRRAHGGACWQDGSVTIGLDASFAKFHMESMDVFTFHEILEEHVTALTAGLGFVSGSYDFLIGATARSFFQKSTTSGMFPNPSTDETDAVLFDAGVELRKRASVQGWDVESGFGVAIVNAGEDIDNWSPRSDILGAAVRMESPTVDVFSARVPMIAFAMNFDTSKPQADDWEWMLGTEFAVAQTFFLRYGLHTYTGDEHPDPALAAWGAGVGIPAGKLRTRLDYGRRAEAFGKFERWELTVEWSL